VYTRTTEVRGQDPQTISGGAVLSSSRTFQAEPSHLNLSRLRSLEGSTGIDDE